MDMTDENYYNYENQNIGDNQDKKNFYILSIGIATIFFILALSVVFLGLFFGGQSDLDKGNGSNYEIPVAGNPSSEDKAESELGVITPIQLEEDEEENTDNSDTPYIRKVNESYSFTDGLVSCLEKDKMDVDCRMLFTDPKIEEECNNLNELGDKCFYNSAIINQDSLYCENIEEGELREKCLYELDFEEQEEKI